MNQKQKIITTVQEFYKVNLKKKSGKRKYVRPKQVAIELLWNFTEMSITEISEEFDIHYSSAIHARKTVWNLCKTDPKLRQQVIQLETLLE